MVKVFVDADAAPKDVVASARRLAAVYHADVVTVSSINHMLEGEGHISVDAHPQAVDMVIIGEIKTGEPTIVITQDYGLASLALGKGAKAISPKGTEYTADNIDLLLFERALHAHERRATGRNKGPKARTKADQAKFAANLESMLRSIGDGDRL